MPTSAPQGRGGARHFKKPYVETGLLLKLLKKHEDLLLDLKGYESRSRNSAVDPKALHRCLPLLEDIVALEPSAEVHPQPLRNALLQLLATNPKLNSTRFNGSVWTNMKAERLNVLLSHVRKLARSGGSSCLAALTGSEFERLTETLQKVVLRPEDEAALEKEKGGVTWQAAERGELSLKEKVKQIADENSDIDDAADALQDSMTKGEKSKAWNRHQNHLKKDENAKEEFDNLGRLSMICDTAAPHSSYPALKGKTKKVRAKKGWVEEIVDELQPFIREIGYDIDEDALKVLLEYLKAAEPTASKLCIPKIQAFARQALLIDCSDKRLTLLFQSLDHASAAIVYTLLSLDKHLDDAAGKPEGAGKGAQHAMEYLRRLQACEESFACKLFPNAQMQFPCVVLEYKHQFQLLKTTDLAEKYNEDMWGPDKTSYWVTGALAFVPEHRLSPDRKFLVQDYMNRIPKLGEEKFKRVKWDSVVLVELDMAEAFQIDVRARSKRATGLQQLQKGSDGSLNRTIQDGKNLLEAVFLGDALSPEAVSGSVVQRWLQRPLLGGALAEGDRRKTLLCKQYFEGGCNRGGNCAFAHGETEQRQPPGWQEKPKMKLCEKFPNFCEFGRYCHNAHGQEGDRRKTLLCKQYFEGGCNRGGDCDFAHGEAEQRQPPGWQEKPKMKLCEKFPNFCEFGRYCHNAHGQDELQVRAPGPRLTAQPEAEQVDYPQPEAGERQKTLLCRFAAMGTCKHGDDCKFAHGEHEQERPIDWEEKPKSRFCSHFRERRFCQFGRYCVFAHAEEELQEGDRRKTLLCKQYFEGGCNRGGDCDFAHGEAEQRQPPGWQEKPKMKLCEKFPNFCEFGRYCHNAHGQEKPKEELCKKFFQKGFCKHGRYCPKAHAEEELQESARRKTLLCKMQKSGFCWKGNDCNFAHGEDEQLPPPDYEEKDKTKLCESRYFSGFCAKGRYCAYAHQRNEIKEERPSTRVEARTLSEGGLAKVHGMSDDADLNGCQVKLLAWEEDKKQWIIQLPNGRPRTLPQDNLSPVPDAKADQEDAMRQLQGSLQGQFAEGVDPLQVCDPWAAAKAGGRSKILLCLFHFLQKCGAGDSCDYAHNEDEQVEPLNYQARTFKNKMCKDFFPYGFCPRGKYCDWAHDPDELYKAKSEICRHFLRAGECRHGAHCLYAHGTNDLLHDKVGPLAFAVREMLGDDTWLKVVLDWALGRSPQPFVC
ncbi:unnamed protein product [Effrenium voratum]|uniref:C3H1-type domain-containing protein n=1 Tax=Effrenium voratum TaxID=2562239 RepID=A0AA36HNV9_9DINO|nr:unnamed protein product [Effrenium voratum]